MQENPYEAPSDTKDWRGFLYGLVRRKREPAKCAFCGNVKEPLIEGIGLAKKGFLICRECAVRAVELFDQELSLKADSRVADD